MNVMNQFSQFDQSIYSINFNQTIDSINFNQSMQTTDLINQSINLSIHQLVQQLIYQISHIFIFTTYKTAVEYGNSNMFMP